MEMLPENPELSIVVPTLREVRSIPLLVEQMVTVLHAGRIKWELIIVDDDSRDGTRELCEKLIADGYPIRLMVRRNARGLASAAAAGLRRARAPVLAVMDADLSHPVSSLPVFYRAIRNGFDFVVGSRYIPGGSTDDRWTVYRYLNSKLASFLARPLTRISDPMSGFFAMSQRVWRRCDDISPPGYKIGLEIIVKGSPSRVREEPIHFRTREFGQSKLTLKQQSLYLVQLMSLYRYHFRQHAKRRNPVQGNR